MTGERKNLIKDKELTTKELDKRAEFYREVYLRPTRHEIPEVFIHIKAETLVIYKSAFNRFVRWCDKRRFPSLPTRSKVVAMYICEMHGAHLSTIDISVSAIKYLHEISGNVIMGDQQNYNHVRKGIQRAKKEGIVLYEKKKKER